jgi:hypothetical protein
MRRNWWVLIPFLDKHIRCVGSSHLFRGICGEMQSLRHCSRF